MSTPDPSIPTVPGTYGPQHVMQSAAGYYIGTLYLEVFEDDPLFPQEQHEPFLVPGSRDSHYFNTAEEAQAFLDYMNAGNCEPSELEIEESNSRHLNPEN